MAFLHLSAIPVAHFSRFFSNQHIQRKFPQSFHPFSHCGTSLSIESTYVLLRSTCRPDNCPYYLMYSPKLQCSCISTRKFTSLFRKCVGKTFYPSLHSLLRVPFLCVFSLRPLRDSISQRNFAGIRYKICSKLLRQRTRETR